MTGLTIVQSTTNAHNASDGTTAQVHFGAAPTNGNLLIAIGTVWDTNGAPSAASGWTIRAQAHGTGSQMYVVLYSKYAGAGESANQLPEGNGRNLWEMACWEISGVTGTWASDFIAASLQPDLAQVQTSPRTTSSFNTSNNNELILAAAAGNFVAATVLSQTGGGTTDSTTSSPDSTECSIVSWHRVEATSGTAITNTIAWSPTTANNVGAVFVELQSASAGSETSTASLAIAKPSFTAAAGQSDPVSASLAIAKPSFTVTAQEIKERAAVTLAIGKANFAASSSVTLPTTSATLAIAKPSFVGAITVTHRTTASIAIGAMTLLARDIIVRTTQFTQQVLADNTVAARLTQFGLDTLGKNTVNARATFMSLLVLARGGEPPLQPNPLSLHDAGREPVLRLRFVNMYPEPTPQGPGTEARYQRAGLYAAAQYSGGPVQAIQHWAGPDPGTEEFLMTISGGSVFRDNVNIGSIDPFLDPTWFPRGKRIHCARSETQFMACSNGKIYSIQLNAVTQVATTGILPAGIRDVAFLAGRFIYILNDDSGQFYFSALGDGTTIDGLSVVTVAEDDPAILLAAWDLADDICFFTRDSVEFWYASADPANPYQRSTGRRYNKGLLAQDSVELIDNSLFWLGSDRQIYRTGAVPIRVSNFDVEDRIRRLTDDEVQQCYGYGVSIGGHNFYVIHLMSQGTWAYDIASKTWAEWDSYNKDRFRVFCSDDTFRIFGDYYTGYLMGMDGGQYVDMDGAGGFVPIERVVSAFYPLRKGRHVNFNLILHATRGVGGRVEMRWSDHEGRDWSPWLIASLGDVGDHGEAAKAVWSMLGGMSPPGRLYEFRCTDDCYFAPYMLRVDEERP